MTVFISPDPIISPEPENTAAMPIIKWLGMAAVVLASNVVGGLVGYQMHLQDQDRVAGLVNTNGMYNQLEFLKIQTAILVIADKYPGTELHDDIFNIFASGGPPHDPFSKPLHIPPYRGKK